MLVNINTKMADVKPNPHVRKRKRSFLKQQKRHGKKGNFGQGVELSEDQYQYFIRIHEVINSSKDSEDLEMLACNVIDEMSGTEVDTCSNQLASRVVEKLVEHSPDDKLVTLAKVLGNHLRVVYSDPFSSHVLQKITVTLASRVIDLHTPDSKSKRSAEMAEDLKTEFLRIAKFGLNNVEDFMFDTYANRVLRTLFACVNGHPVKAEVQKDYEPKHKPAPVPEGFSDLAESFIKKVTSWPQFNDLTVQVLPSGCLQALVLSVSGQPKLSKKICKRVLEAVESNPKVDFTSEQNAPLLHLIESAIVCSPPKLYQQFYELLFKGKLTDLALSKTGNFAVQKLVSSCPTKETFEEMFDHLVGLFDKLLTWKMTGVLLAIARACTRLKSKQADFSKALLAALDCSDQERQLQSFPIICCLCKHDEYDPSTSKVSLHGSLIAQQMLFHTKPIRLVNSLLGMSTDHLVTLLCDPRGCHLTDAYVMSTFVGEKSREKLYKKLQGQYATLALSKHGSRSFDAIWTFCNTKQRSYVVEEVKPHQSGILSTPWGRIVAKNIKLDLYREDKEAWYRAFHGEEKRKSK